MPSDLYLQISAIYLYYIIWIDSEYHSPKTFMHISLLLNIQKNPLLLDQNDKNKE